MADSPRSTVANVSNPNAEDGVGDRAAAMLDYDDMCTPRGSARLAATLRRDSFAVVRMPDAARPMLSALDRWAEAIFALDAGTKASRLGPLRSTPSGQLIGYRDDPGSREFLELRLARNGMRSPCPNPFASGSNAALDAPRTSDRDAPVARALGFDAAMRGTIDLLSALGTVALNAIATDLGVHPRAFLSLLDAPPLTSSSAAVAATPTTASTERKERDGDQPPLSNAVLRICRYESEEAGAAVAPPSAPQSRGGSGAHAGTDERTASGAAVAFGEHTDSSFLTIAPCSAVPGLELLVASSRREKGGRGDPSRARSAKGEGGSAPPRVWRMPEGEAACAACGGCACIVMVGEFVNVLTRRSYPAAIHRVLRPRAGAGARRSFPLLIRGRDDAIIATRKYNLAALFAAARAAADASGCAGAEPDADAVIAAAEAGEGPLLNLDGLALGELHAFMAQRRARQTAERCGGAGARSGARGGLLVGEATAARIAPR